MKIFSWFQNNVPQRFPFQHTDPQLLLSTKISSEIIELKRLLSQTDDSIVLVSFDWLESLNGYLQGLTRPPIMNHRKIITKTGGLKKGLIPERDYFFLYKPVWDFMKLKEDQTITIDVNKRLKKLDYLNLAQKTARSLLGDLETSRADPTEIHLPSILPRNEEDPLLDLDSLKKESISTNFTSNTFNDSEHNLISGSTRLQKGRVGLENPGLLCYLNSGIQCLLSINSLVLYMLKSDTTGHLDKKFTSNLFAKLINSVFSLRSGTIKPTRLWKFIVQHFPNNTQHDMPEFIRFFINQLDYELGENNYIQQCIFNGILCSKVICKDCKNISYKNEAFVDLQIELSESIEKSIELFTKEEDLIGGYYCDRCNGRKDAMKELSILEPPKSLILQVKRFKQTPHPHKLTGFIRYKKRMLIETIKGRKPYELVAVGVHIGSINSGHYTTYAKRSRTWYFFDDSLCLKSSLKASLSQRAYLLLYTLSDP